MIPDPEDRFYARLIRIIAVSVTAAIVVLCLGLIILVIAALIEVG